MSSLVTYLILHHSSRHLFSDKMCLLCSRGQSAQQLIRPMYMCLRASSVSEVKFNNISIFLAHHVIVNKHFFQKQM